MAHNARVRTDQTAWTTGAVMPAEFDELDENGFSAINGDAGGVWSPNEEPIVIGGFGLEVSGGFFSSAATTLGDNPFGDLVTVNALSTFQGSATFEEPVSFLSSIEIDGEAIFAVLATFLGDVTIGDDPFVDTFTVNATSVFTGSAAFEAPVGFVDSAEFSDVTTFALLATFLDDIAVLGDVDVGGSVTVTGDVTADEVFATGASLGELAVGTLVVPPAGAFVLNEAMTFATNGRVPFRYAVGPDANTTYEVGDANLVSISTLTDDRVYTVDDTGAVNGDFILILKLATAQTLTVSLPGSSPVVIAPATRKAILVWQFSSGTWVSITWEIGLLS